MNVIDIFTFINDNNYIFFGITIGAVGIHYLLNRKKGSKKETSATAEKRGL